MKIYLKEYREELGITQKEFARLVGLNERTVNDIETGKTRPKADTLVRLADALGLMTDELLGHRLKEPQIYNDNGVWKIES
ncbi:helix-turn-helix domain-containing protein [Globicatella sanguinis]